MNETFEKLRPEYESSLRQAKITRQQDALDVAAKLLRTRAAYADAAAKTGVPMALLMALNERESSGRLDTYLGNGDPLDERTRDVPRGRGPFPTWTMGAVDAINYQHMAGIQDWSWARALFEGELWNGFGYRMHGRHSAYLWGGTSIQQYGKYDKDGHWAAGEWDTQLGIVAIMAALVKLDPSLQLPSSDEIPAPVWPPEELNGGGHGVNWLQDVLNHVQNAGLIVDGSFGRKTCAALKGFQAARGLPVTGVADAGTVAALERAYEAGEAPTQAPAARVSATNDSPAPQGLMSGEVYLHSVQPVVPDTPMIRRGDPVSGEHLSLYPIYDHDLAMLCQGIYNYPGGPSVLWNHFDAGDDDGVCWAVKRIGDVDVIVFRGSTTLEDWVDDVEAVAETLGADTVLGPVHKGFGFGLPLVAQEVLSRGAPQIIVTGHSLGAARASIFAGILKASGKPPLACVRFGEPRPGYQQLADYLKDIPGRNYRNGRGIRGDLITGLPYSTSWMPWVNSMPFTEVSAPPPENDQWGPFSWHHIQLYASALATSNTGTTP